MRYNGGTMKTLLGVCVGLMIGGAAPAMAADQQIRLKDGTSFPGTVLEKDAKYVVLGVPRASVASVDGQPLPDPVAKGAPAPGISAVDLAGVTQTLGAGNGKATLVQFWATWCPHCRNDLPLMKEVAAKFKGQPLSIVSISVDRDRDALSAFMKDHPLAYPVIAAYDPRNATPPLLSDRYEIQGIPAYYFIDAQGRILETWSGSLTEAKTDLMSIVQPVVSTINPPARSKR